jgi:hypothetical protein
MRNEWRVNGSTVALGSNAIEELSNIEINEGCSMEMVPIMYIVLFLVLDLLDVVLAG